MNAATVVVEILVAGLGALIWCALLIALIFGKDVPKDLFGAVNGWEEFATVLLLGFAYFLGVLVDRLADYIFSIPQWLAKRKIVEKIVTVVGWPVRSLATLDTKDEGDRLKLLATDGRLAVFLEYLRSAVRILRAGTLNLLLIVVFGTVLAFDECYEHRKSVLWLGVVVVAVSFFVYAVAECAFRKFVELPLSNGN